MGEERLGNGVTGYRFGSEVLNIPVWERMKEGETHYWNFRCPEILRLKLRGKIGKRKKINSTARKKLRPADVGVLRKRAEFRKWVGHPD